MYAPFGVVEKPGANILPASGTRAASWSPRHPQATSMSSRSRRFLEHRPDGALFPQRPKLGTCDRPLRLWERASSASSSAATISTGLPPSSMA